MSNQPATIPAYFRLSKLILLAFAAFVSFAHSFADPQISEFMASNKTGFVDEDGAFSDWIEIHNPDATAANLAAWYLTDDAANKTKWKFPAITIPAGGYLVVFASSKDRRDADTPLHTNFGLSAEGEYLGLIKPDGTTVAAEYSPSYPAQSNDVSYGLTLPSLPGEIPPAGFFSTPTPGAPNGNTNGTAVTLTEEVLFSTPPGLFPDTLALTLTGQNPGQKIRYTLSPPSDTGATVPAPTLISTEYTGPIILTSSLIVRAAVFSSDDTESGPVTSSQYVKLSMSGSDGLNNFSSQLPVMVIDSHGLGDMIKDDIDRAGWVYGFAPDANGSTTLTAATSFAIPVAFAVRGNSSALFPKQSFKMKFRNAAGGKQALAPFGLPAFEKWHLIGMWHFERSHIRNAYIYELSNRIGLWAPRTRFVEVFVNRNDDGLDAQDYAGIYAITDKIEPNPLRVNIASLSKSANVAPEITGGYMMKFDWYDHGDYVFTTKLGRALIMDTPDAEDITAEQADYIHSYVQSMEDALVADSASNWASRTYLDYINRD